MYSRSLDPHRYSPLPEHYGGSAFRADGTPTPIPVKRAHDPTMRSMLPSSRAEDEGAVPSEADLQENPPTTSAAVHGDRDPEHPPSECGDCHDDPQEPPRSPCDDHKKKEDRSSFLSRISGSLLPGMREDDLLLLLLMLLLSREEGNEDALLLLALVLLAK